MARATEQPAYAGPPPAWTRPGFIVAALFALLMVAMVIGIVLIRPDSSGTVTGSPGATGGPSEVASSDADADAEADIPTAAPSDVTWQPMGQTAVPVSKSAGPFQITDTTASGFAHTATGALIAAAQLTFRSDFYAGRSVWEPTITRQYVPGPNRDRLLERMRSWPPKTSDDRPVTEISGYLYQAYSADTAVIGLIFQVAGDPDSRYITTLTLQWRDGDWRMVAPPDGSWASMVHWAEVWTGAVEWKVPPSTSTGGQGGGTVVGAFVAQPLVAQPLKDPCGGHTPCDPKANEGTKAYDDCTDRVSGPMDVCGAMASDWNTSENQKIYDKADKACADSDKRNDIVDRGKCFLIDGKECWIRESDYCDPVFGKQNKDEDLACKDGIFNKCYILSDGSKCEDPFGTRRDQSKCATFYDPNDKGESWVDKLILTDLKNSLKWAYRSVVSFWLELPAPNVSDDASNGNPVYWLRQRLSWFIALTAACSIIIAGAKIAIQRDGREAAAVARGLVRLVILNGGGATAAVLMTQASDVYTSWIMNQAMGNDPGTKIDKLFDKLLGGDITGVGDVLPTFVVLALGFLLLASGILQIILLVARDAGLMLLVAILPLAAGVGLTSGGAAMPKRYVKYGIMIILTDAVVATPGAFGLHLIDSNDKMTVFIGAITLTLGAVAPFTLPRLIAPVVGSGNVSNDAVDRGARPYMDKLFGPKGSAKSSQSVSRPGGAVRGAAAAAASFGSGNARGASSGIPSTPAASRNRSRVKDFASGVVRASAATAKAPVQAAGLIVAGTAKTAVGAGKLTETAVSKAGYTASGAFENGPSW